jgi:hypothetical protein
MFCGEWLVSVLGLMVSFWLASGAEFDDWPKSYIAKWREKRAGISEILSKGLRAALSR